MLVIRKISAVVLFIVYCAVWAHNQSHIHCATTGDVIIATTQQCEDHSHSCQNDNLCHSPHNHSHSANCEIILSVPQNDTLQKLLDEASIISFVTDIEYEKGSDILSSFCNTAIELAEAVFKEQSHIIDQLKKTSYSFRAPPYSIV